MEITNKEYLEAKKIVDNYNQQEKIKEEIKKKQNTNNDIVANFFILFFLSKI